MFYLGKLETDRDLTVIGGSAAFYEERKKEEKLSVLKPIVVDFFSP